MSRAGAAAVAVRRWLVERAPDVGPLVSVLGALVLVAPLEHAAGRALGLGDGHAWSLTATIEGVSGAALLAGRCVPAALALTGASTLVGALWSADHQRALSGWRDPRALLALVEVLLVVAALIVGHRVHDGIVTARDARARTAAVAAREEQDRDRADRRAARERADVAERERTAQEHEERTRLAEQRHVQEIARTTAYADVRRQETEVELARIAATRGEQEERGERSGPAVPPEDVAAVAGLAPDARTTRGAAQALGWGQTRATRALRVWREQQAPDGAEDDDEGGLRAV